jgi:hypothetical protein
MLNDITAAKTAMNICPVFISFRFSCVQIGGCDFLSSYQLPAAYTETVPLKNRIWGFNERLL